MDDFHAATDIINMWDLHLSTTIKFTSSDLTSGNVERLYCIINSGVDAIITLLILRSIARHNNTEYWQRVVLKITERKWSFDTCARHAQAPISTEAAIFPNTQTGEASKRWTCTRWSWTAAKATGGKTKASWFTRAWRRCSWCRSCSACCRSGESPRATRGSYRLPGRLKESATPWFWAHCHFSWPWWLFSTWFSLGCTLETVVSTPVALFFTLHDRIK